jgi:hypothetical protein
MSVIAKCKILFFGWSVFMVAPLSSCSGPLIKSVPDQFHPVTQINLSAVQFFRPEYEVPEQDDFSHQDRKRECQSPEQLWAPLLKNAAKISSCINQLKPGEIFFRFQKKAQMELQYEERGSSYHPCLKEFLSVIPLPREIYFLGRASSSLDQDVFAVSFNSKDEALVDFAFLTPSPRVSVRVPLSRELKNESDLALWLKTLVFSLFWNEKRIRASYVPEFEAKACFRSDSLFQDKKSGRLPGVFWP